jgi:hypothetical protein
MLPFVLRAEIGRERASALDQLHARSTQLGPRGSRPDIGPQDFLQRAFHPRFIGSKRIAFPALEIVFHFPIGGGLACDPFLPRLNDAELIAALQMTKHWLRPRNETSTKRISRSANAQ